MAAPKHQDSHFQVSTFVRQVIRGLYFVANKFKSKITNHIYLFQKLVWLDYTVHIQGRIQKYDLGREVVGSRPLPFP